MRQYNSSSEEETKKIAAELAKEISGGIIALSGKLGTGKTTFVQGFAKGLGIKEKIISPTFILIRQHKIPKTNRTLYHIDLYRLEKTPRVKELGLEEIWSDPKNIVLIEWADKIEELLPQNTLYIKIERAESDTRSITVG